MHRALVWILAAAVVPCALANGKTSSLIDAGNNLAAVAPPGMKLSVEASTLLDVSNTPSIGAEGDVDNIVMSVDLAAALGYPTGTPMYLTGVGWNVSLSAMGESWLSDISVLLSASDDVLTGIYLSPGIGDDAPGAQSYAGSGILDFTDNLLDDILLSDGVLRLEFFEAYDDDPGVADGFWDQTSTLELAGVAAPEPGVLPLLALAGTLLRRRTAR